MPPVLLSDANLSNGSLGQRRTVGALVWAMDQERAAAALEHLHHSLWLYWYRYTIVEVKYVPLGGLCPLSTCDPTVLAFARRERWTWVLVPVGAKPVYLQSDTGPGLGTAGR